MRNLKTQTLTVRSKQGIEAQGLYENIKGVPGVKYMTGLYIAFYGENNALNIGYLKIKGAALTAWIEFTKTHRDLYSGAFGITGHEKCKKGATVYYEPVFENYSKVSDEADNSAKELDVHLQEYLTAYFAQKGIEEVEAAYVNKSVAVGQQYSGEPEMQEFTAEEPPEDYADNSDIPW